MSKIQNLYRYFEPSRYELKISPDKKTYFFKGTVLISGKRKGRVDNLVLHSKELQVSLVKVNNVPCSFKLSLPDELIIKLPAKASNDLEIYIEFSGKITKPMNGLYPCYGRDGQVILATQFESHFARQVFPCIDEPAAKAVFSLSVTAALGDIVLSNTEPKTISKKGQMATTIFEDTPKMSTYLLAFCIGKLEKRQATTCDGVLVRAWATPDKVEQTNFALDVAVRSLEFFNNYFEIPYPLKKCDLVALPDFAAGAMENWGLITFRETCMLVDSGNTSHEAKQFAAMTIAHEVAHQWFGNLVTMKWWDDLWLNEGFASWIEFMAVDKLFPDWQMWTQFIAIEQQLALRLDALENSHPVEATITNPGEINTIFDSISYSKGASIIHMLHEFLGKNDFRLGLIHYLKKHSYGSACTADLWEALHESSHKPVAAFMAKWTAQIGFPLVSIQPKGKSLQLSQQRFLPKSLTKNNEIWPIPLQSSILRITTLEQQKLSVDSPNNIDNFRINENRSGFYITQYWPRQYSKLGQQIKSDSLPEVDRIGLLADMLALAKSGYLPATQLLSMLANYANESSPAVWDIIAMTLGDLRHVMGDRFIEAIKPFAREMSCTQVKRLGWQENDKESYFDKLLRPVVLATAASGDDQKVVAKAFDIYQKAKAIEDIAPNLRNMVLMIVSKRGGKKDFDKLFRFYEKAASPEDKVTLAHAMVNFRKLPEIKRALSLIKSRDVRLQDVSYWIAYSFVNPVARNLTWEWLKDNWAWLKENMGSDMSYPRLPMYAARAFSDKSFIKPYKKFFQKVSEPGLDRAIKQGLETIKMQAGWRKHDEQPLLDYLARG